MRSRRKDAIVSPSGGSVGIGFAIPAETVKSVIAQLKDKGKVIRGWIGVQIQSITPELAENLGLKETRGALVAEPESDGPASKAGIEPGDIIIAVNSKPIGELRDRKNGMPIDLDQDGGRCARADVGSSSRRMVTP